MDFGRLPSVDGVDFTLPPPDAANLETFRHLTGSETPRVLLGSPQWGHDGYVGKIYPEGARKQDYLFHYARQFPTVELNTTFYGVRPDLLARWRDATPESFRFCPKIPRTISHDLSLVDAEAETADFLESMAQFRERLGLVWMLLPESFGPTRARALVNYLRGWPRQVPLAVELRHAGWFRDRQLLNRVFAVFEETETTPVLTDVAGRRDVLHQRVTTATVVLRFVGNRLHPSDFARIGPWVDQLGSWIDQGVRTVYLFLHQPQEEENVELAERFAVEFERRCGLSVKRPERVVRVEQGQLF